jgi:hypothetical protein
MKSFPSCLLPLTIVLLLSSCSKTVYYTTWQNTAVKADGVPNEWTLPLRYFDVKSKLQYSISNDADNLYLCIRATDEATQMKIIRAGLQFWVDTTVKEKQHFGLLYPLAFNGLRKSRSEADSGFSRMPEAYEQGGKRVKSRFDKEPKQMQLIGFNISANGFTSLENPYGILANIDWDSFGIMTYEAAVPLRTIYRKESFQPDSIKSLTISIIVPGISLQPRPGGSGEGHRGGGMDGGVHSGGGGGHYGGGPKGRSGGGGYSRGPDNSTDLTKNNIIKFRYLFARH